MERLHGDFTPWILIPGSKKPSLTGQNDFFGSDSSFMRLPCLT